MQDSTQHKKNSYFSDNILLQMPTNYLQLYMINYKL